MAVLIVSFVFLTVFLFCILANICCCSREIARHWRTRSVLVDATPMLHADATLLHAIDAPTPTP